MPTRENAFPIQSYYLFQSEGKDPVRDFEQLTSLKVNRQDVFVYPIAPLEKTPKGEKSWWDKFCDDGWSHITFGTVSIGAGVGILFIFSGPIGWTSAGLAIAGGGTSLFSGVRQLNVSDPKEKQFYAQLGDASLSLNNIPGFLTGSATYVLTRSYDRSINYASWAGLASSGLSLAGAAGNAFRLQKLYNLEIGLGNTAWRSGRPRKFNAILMEIDPKGLEGSHLIPQRHVKKIVEKAPRSIARAIENLNNGPLGIRFMTPMEHALVDSSRYRMLPPAQKEVLAAAAPFRSMLLEESPMLADFLGIVPNMSPTLRPVANSLVITAGRGIKANSTSTSDR